MEIASPDFELQASAAGQASLALSGDWIIAADCPASIDLLQQLEQSPPASLTVSTEQLGEWDSALPSFLLQCAYFCSSHSIELDTGALPEGAQKLLKVATAVSPLVTPAVAPKSLAERLNPLPGLQALAGRVETSLEFIGAITVAMIRLAAGKANTRRVDFLTFVHQCGPDAIGIITLTSFLVGMILAYLGAAQLAQFGAQIYVADLVTVGILREMGVLMTAVVMAGRTGAAYAAQLGTMQTNEEIDAITTLGISPIEFLVLPRMLALIVIMPLLTLYANVVGIFGGALVALGMDVSLTQFMVQFQKVISFTHLNVGLFKSVVFGVLIAIAGCRAGMQCGRSSAAVGQAATRAVVVSIVYLIVADAAINILFQKIGV